MFNIKFKQFDLRFILRWKFKVKKWTKHEMLKQEKIYEEKQAFFLNAMQIVDKGNNF